MVFIRQAEPDDMPACAALPATYVTRMAWQLTLDGDAGRTGPLNLSLSQIRLPRMLTLSLPSAMVPLHATWEQQDHIVVAIDAEIVCGYLCLQTIPDQGHAIISRLLVDVPMRGNGVGTELIRAAHGWTAEQGLLRLLAHTPLRNTPGSTFYQRRGFRICGVSEHSYPTREDALLLERWV
jgi:ribosomal protein S18 acetylase RimI-like enzyme